MGLGLHSVGGGGRGTLWVFSPFEKKLLYSHLFNEGAMPSYKGKAKAQILTEAFLRALRE